MCPGSHPGLAEATYIKKGAEALSSKVGELLTGIDSHRWCSALRAALRAPPVRRWRTGRTGRWGAEMNLMFVVGARALIRALGEAIFTKKGADVPGTGV